MWDSKGLEKMREGDEVGGKRMCSLFTVLLQNTVDEKGNSLVSPWHTLSEDLLINLMF